MKKYVKFCSQRHQLPTGAIAVGSSRVVYHRILAQICVTTVVVVVLLSFEIPLSSALMMLCEYKYSF
jgi:hypothetical protein